MIDHSEMLKLRRWNTPTIYNGWEQIAKNPDRLFPFNKENVIDYMEEMGVMVGRAITVKCMPSNSSYADKGPELWKAYRKYVASIKGPKIVVVQDMDKPNFVGAFWGEVNSTIHRSLGCVGTICDGAIRDVEDMKHAGFKALASRKCIGHAYSIPIEWGCEVEVFGKKINEGQLIHADHHGFMVIEECDEDKLLDACLFMDNAECDAMIPYPKDSWNLGGEEKLNFIEDNLANFGKLVSEKFSGNKGEW